ncbi:MAG TPA: hypothetical protein VNJ53_00580, partial [Gaiellaceae bacterium]|nr:hypothetical protein [Gaiellaceae bacterium]
RNEPTPEADRYGVGSASCLKLREQMPDVGLHGLLREEEPLADLAIHEPVCDELEHLDLARRRVLAELPLDLGSERDDRPVASCAAPRRSRLEATAVIAVAIEDLLALGSVHALPIGVAGDPL